MKYSVYVDGPKPEWTLTLDGVPLDRVVEFDTEAGWVLKLCTGERDGHPDGTHLNPQARDEVCRVRLHGDVRLFRPGK